MGPAVAYACGGNYVVQSGETLSTIADRLYKNAGLWSRIHASNRDQIGEDPSSVSVGQALAIPCIDGLPALLEQNAMDAQLPKPSQPAAVPQPEPIEIADVPRSETVTRRAGGLFQPVGTQSIRMLTGSQFRPFTDRDMPGGGMMTEVVQAAMNAAVGEDQHRTYWLDGWDEHVDLALGGQAIEAAFPIAKPDCTTDPSQAACADFYYSEAMFEYLELLYVDQSRPLAFLQDSDLEGRVLCRPVGHQTHILDANGRRWLADAKMTLVQPQLVSDCFFQLLDGEVDAVVMNEFTARETLALMGLQVRIVPLEAQPIAISSLHVMVHKDHPQAQVVLAQINDGLSRIRADGQHQSIVARYLKAIWAPN